MPFARNFLGYSFVEPAIYKIKFTRIAVTVRNNFCKFCKKEIQTIPVLSSRLKNYSSIF